MGHASINNLQKIANDMDIKLTGNIQKCESCLQAKMKQKPVTKNPLEEGPRPGQRLGMDITSCK